MLNLYAIAKDPEFKRAKATAKKTMGAGLPKDVERMMCDPDLRRKFDKKAKKVAPRVKKYLLRKAALNYRKKGATAK